jgi:hypothetical protein
MVLGVAMLFTPRPLKEKELKSEELKLQEVDGQGRARK